MNQRNKYDVIVVGGGPNGLVAAAYLAKAGQDVLLLEKREMVGGIAVTEELFPGYKCSSLVDGAGNFSSTIIDDLRLLQHGLEFLSIDPLLVSPLPGGDHLTIWHDVDRTADEIARFSAEDGQAYPHFVELMTNLSRVVASLNDMTPPDMPVITLSDIRAGLKMVNPVRKMGRKNIAEIFRVLPMPISDLLNEWFESDIVKGTLAASALNNISFGPEEAGTAYMFLYNWATSNNSLFRSSGQIKDGIGSLTQSIANAASAFGVEIVTSAEVESITIGEGAVTGVTLSGGKAIQADIVVSAVDMNTTYLKLIEPYYLDQSFVKHVRNIKYRGTTARAHFALTGLPTFTALSGDAQQLLYGHIQIAPTMTYLQKAFDPTKYGEYSDQPYLDIKMPSLTDSSLAPDERHLMSVTVKYMPYHLRHDDWDGLGDKVVRLISDTMTQYAPDFPKFVEDSYFISPRDMETIYGLPEGNIVYGEMTLDQFLWMRPIPGYAQYRGPVAGLYQCSAATHPGGGVTGINGRNAAHQILRD